MREFVKFVLICSLATFFMNADELEFDTLEISAKEIKDGEKHFLTPGAVSSRGEISGNTQSIDSIVRSIPGSYTHTDQT